MADDDLILCVRCLATLRPGAGNFWVVHIDAVADPTPPAFTEQEVCRDVQSQWAQLVQEMRDISPREAMDQVHRHVVVHLCNRCFARWIEDPAN